MNLKMTAILGLGLVIAAPSATLRLGHAPADGTMLKLALTTPAMAAEDISFDDLEVSMGQASIKIPEIKISGSSLSKSDLEGLFNGKWSLATADVLSRFDASSIDIPEIDLDVTMPGHAKGGTGKAEPMSQHIVYSDVKFEDIKAGKVAHASAEGMTSEVKGEAPMTFTLGAFNGTDYDLVAAMRFVYGSAQPGEPLKQISGPASFENMEIKGPEGVEVKGGKVSTGAIKARPLSTPLVTLIPTMMEAGKNGKTPDKAETVKMMGMLAEFYDAFAVDGVSFSDIAVTAPSPMFEGASLKTFKIGEIANSRYSEFGIEGLEVKAAGGHVTLDRLAFLGMDLKPFLQAMSVAAKDGEEGMKNMNWRTAIPHLDGIVVKKLDINLPMMPGPTKTLTLANYELKLANYIGGIPTTIRSETDNLAGDTALLEEKGQQIEALGYKHLDLTSILDLAWNAADKSIAVKEISAKGVDMGAFSIKGSLGNAARELFEGSPSQMQAAGLGVTVHDVSLRVDNNGLLDRFVTQMAANEHTTPDKLRAQWGAQAALGIPQILGGSDQAKQIGNAVATFIANPKSLSISAKAKNAAGLGFMDVMGNPNPAKVLGLMDVTATANQ